MDVGRQASTSPPGGFRCDPSATPIQDVRGISSCFTRKVAVQNTGAIAWKRIVQAHQAGDVGYQAQHGHVVLGILLYDSPRQYSRACYNTSSIPLGIVKAPGRNVSHEERRGRRMTASVPIRQPNLFQIAVRVLLWNLASVRWALVTLGRQSLTSPSRQRQLIVPCPA